MRTQATFTIEKPPFLMGPDGPKVIHIGYLPAHVEEVYFPHAEVVGDVACLHEFEDIAGMASSLDALIDAPEAAQQLGERGRAHAEKYFSATQILPRYEAVYREVLR